MVEKTVQQKVELMAHYWVEMKVEWLVEMTVKVMDSL